MKYARLTKEQFESLENEFTRFLAAQQINKEEWDALKVNSPEVAEQELDVFSDLIWEGALQNAQYIEHFSKNHIFLFRFDEQEIATMVFTCQEESVDFMQKSGLEWLAEHLFTDQVTLRKGAKKFGNDRNKELFELIQQGGILSSGELYEQLTQLLSA